MVAAGRGGHLVNVSSAAGLVALPWHAAYSASKFGLRGLSEVLRFDLARHRIGVSVVVPGAVNTPLVNTVEIAGVDREDPRVQRLVNRFTGHAVAPEVVADKILAGVRKNRFLIYTSNDIRALYAFKRVAWWPYSIAMRRANDIFTRMVPRTSLGSATRQRAVSYTTARVRSTQSRTVAPAVNRSARVPAARREAAPACRVRTSRVPATRPARRRRGRCSVARACGSWCG